MSSSEKGTDLTSLATEYDILGEVSGPASTHSYSATRKATDAKRRDDDPGVVITVFDRDADDEGNALSHLAADVKTLAGNPHRRLLPIVDGRWVGEGAFAVVSQRIPDETIAQKIAKGEQFTTPRIAAILREVNGLLEWARQQQIVNRAVTPDRIYLESNSDRVRVAFGVVPIRRMQHTDPATTDARTIVRLAMAMLTGSNDPKAYETACLADARPDLPERLCVATTKLLDDSVPHDADEVASFLAIVGMADPIFEGESERDRIRQEILEEQRVEREKLAAERAEFEAAMAKERSEFADHMVEKRSKLANDLVEARDRLSNERDDLRSAAETERVSLAAQRTMLEQTTAAQRAELERVAAEDRRKVEQLRAELKHAGELEIERKREVALENVTDDESTLDDESLRAAEFEPPTLAPLSELSFENDTPLMSTDVIEAPELEEPSVKELLGGRSGRRWMVPVALAIVVGAIGISAIALSARSSKSARTTATANPAVSPPTLVASAPAAAVATPAVPLPATVDSAGGSIGLKAESLKVVKPKPRPKPKPVDSTSTDPMSLTDVLPGYKAPPKGAAKRDSVTRRDSVARPDTAQP